MALLYRFIPLLSTLAGQYTGFYLPHLGEIFTSLALVGSSSLCIYTFPLQKRRCCGRVTRRTLVLLTIGLRVCQNGHPLLDSLLTRRPRAPAVYLGAAYATLFFLPFALISETLNQERSFFGS